MQSPILSFRYGSNQRFPMPSSISSSPILNLEKEILQSFQNANNFSRLNVNIFSPELKFFVNGYLNKKLNHNPQNNPTKNITKMNSNIKKNLK